MTARAAMAADEGRRWQLPVRGNTGELRGVLADLGRHAALKGLAPCRPTVRGLPSAPNPRGYEIAAQMSVYLPWIEMANVAKVVPSMTYVTVPLA